MALRLTQPLTEMSAGIFLEKRRGGGAARLAHNADNFTAICEPIA
jgi:hypothetical protein